MNGFEVSCSAVSELVDDLLEGALSPTRKQAILAHTRSCPACGVLVRTARRVADALDSWEVPEPGPRLAQRAMRKACERILPVDCRQFAALMTSWLEHDLEPPLAARIGQHADECLLCAEQRRAAEEADQALTHWTAPEPPAGFAERVLARLAGNSEPASGGSVAARPVFTWRRIAAAAALLVSIGMTAFLAIERLDEPDGPSNTTVSVSRTSTSPSENPAGQSPGDVTSPDVTPGNATTIVVTVESGDLLPPADPFEPYYTESAAVSSRRGRTLRQTARLVALGGVALGGVERGRRR